MAEELVEIRHSDGEADVALFNRLTDDQISLGDGESMTISIPVFNALHTGKMYIEPELRSAIVELIGVGRVLLSNMYFSQSTADLR